MQLDVQNGYIHFYSFGGEEKGKTHFNYKKQTSHQRPMHHIESK